MLERHALRWIKTQSNVVTAPPTIKSSFLAVEEGQKGSLALCQLCQKAEEGQRGSLALCQMTLYQVVLCQVALYQVAVYQVAVYQVALYQVALYQLASYQIARQRVPESCRVARH